MADLKVELLTQSVAWDIYKHKAPMPHQSKHKTFV